MFDIQFYNMVKKVSAFRDEMGDFKKLKLKIIKDDDSLMESHYQFCRDNNIDMEVFGAYYLYIAINSAYFDNNLKYIQRISDGKCKRGLKKDIIIR